MRRLTVEGFSCIDHAEIDLGRMTILIGPQASGKSVLSKLIYFFYQLVLDQQMVAQSRGGVEALKSHIKERFVEFFPTPAWGPSAFRIEFQLGDYAIRLTRARRDGKVGDKFRVWLSAKAEELHHSLHEIFQAAASTIGSRPDRDTFEFEWRLREKAIDATREQLSEYYIGSQLFVPAGRSFFTSVGRLVVAFEHGGLLDPVTVAFGRRLAAYREQRGARMRRELSVLTQLSDLLGGRVVVERDKEFVETVDGRRVPFAALSSGQQELIPLLMILDSMGGITTRPPLASRMLYIEEPEAHLFPSAQSRLVEFLAGYSRRPVPLNLLVTTHSPYVLAKINNLLRAGALGKKLGEDSHAAIAKIIPQRSWLAPGSTVAYAVVDRKLRSIMDADGFVDAEYLDSVSGNLAEEFNALLQLEHGS